MEKVHTEAEPARTKEVSKNYRIYVLAILTLVYTFNFIDRQILVILQESVKAELQLSDAQLGLLTGLAFAVFYVSLGIPIARWADRGNRRDIIALAITVWSGMTVLCGMAQNYLQLLLYRIGVGVGEAGCSPPAHSMISDYFPPQQRATAMSVYSMGVYIGILAGFLIGGWVNQMFGWRMAFFLVGAPGLLVALVLRLTVREPVRGMYDGGTEAAPPSFRATMAALWQLRSFRYFSLGTALAAFTSYGIGNFMPSFLIRFHGFDSLQTGASLALASGIGGGLGTICGGIIADRKGAADKRWYLWVSVITQIMNVPLILAGLFAGGATAALVFIFCATFTGACYLGPTLAITHTLVKPRMRAMASAVLFLILNLIGLGFGPLTVGLLSDFLVATHGAESLRYSMAIVALMALVAALCFFMGARRLPGDLARS
ncbi:MFS transporter [Exilibacterium tricleocarpae]|uniref:MFS transporter n=1 Tax=Exilibacterium tricleocarpae TaxID=2591008 RepID=A0A545U9X0_9GAMM|nr:MFS transporter [Exilibacterium tricleocarpae]TQV86274.1 MFS transporter [Exilibacterium tricleocarpae]